MSRRLGLLLPVVLTAVLCFYKLGQWPVWVDEAFTWEVAGRAFSGIVEGAAKDRHPPLYYLFVAPFLWFGDSDFLLRLPSAIAVVAGVAVVAFTAPKHLGDRDGAIAAWMCALAPTPVLFAHTARMYGLLFFLGAVLLAASLRLASGRGRWPGAVLLVLAGSATIWTHYAGLASIGGAAIGASLGYLLVPGLTWRRRVGGVALVAGLVALIAASFWPWVTGPLPVQLATKDAPAARTLSVLGYLLWNFDGRVPVASWGLLALESLGVAVAGVAVLRGEAADRPRRVVVAAVLLGWAIAGIAAPWFASRSEPAQNPRNYLSLLPAAAMLAAVGVGAILDFIQRAAPRLPGMAALSGAALRSAALPVVVLAGVSAEPMVDLLTRPVSPQEPGSWFHYRREALELDYSIPSDAALSVNPTYMLRQLAKYAPGLQTRSQRLVLARRAWLGFGRSVTPDGALVSGYSDACVFKHAFRLVIYAPEGPGCEQLRNRVALVGEADSYPPFLLEMVQRERQAGQLVRAAELARKAAQVLRGHPGAWTTLAEIQLEAGAFDDALVAATEALEIARTWRFNGGIIAAMSDQRAAALVQLGRAPEADAALALGRCAKAHYRPYLCGTRLEVWGRPDLAGAASVSVSAGAAVSPRPAPTSLPALTEPQDADPPSESLPGLERAALWDPEGSALPEGWITYAGSAMPAAARGVEGALVLGSTATPALAVVCGPSTPVATPATLRLRWRARVEPGPVSWAVIEARPTDVAGHVIRANGGPIISWVLATNVPTEWRIDRVEYALPPGATGLRVCLKADAAARAELELDWMELSGPAG